MTALVATDGDEFEAGAGADDVDQAAAGVIDAEVLRIDIGGQRGDDGVVADVGPTGGAIVEGEKVAVALENILTVGQGGVGGEAIDVADFDTLALPVDEPGDEHGSENRNEPFHWENQTIDGQFGEGFSRQGGGF